jgi:hypothetical protein
MWNSLDFLEVEKKEGRTNELIPNTTDSTKLIVKQ